MDIGENIEATLLVVAASLAHIVLGACILGTVIMAIIILFNIGGKGVQMHVRSWIWTTFWGLLLGGSASAIVGKLQTALTVK